MGCNFRVSESISRGEGVVSNPWLQSTTATEPTKHQYLSSPFLKKGSIGGQVSFVFPKGKKE